MTTNIRIDVHHLTRVEGHGNIVVNVTNGVVEKCEWQVPEAPRFFEAMVRGRHYSEVARITSRICGICSIGHTLASVKATEDGARHRGHATQTPEAARAAQARRELRLPRAARLLPGRARPARRAVGVPARRDARRGRGARAAAQAARRTSGARSSAGARRTRRPSCPAASRRCPRPRELTRAARTGSLAAVPDLEATLATVAALAPARSRPSTGRPSTSPLSVRRGVRPLRRRRADGAARRQRSSATRWPTTAGAPTSTWSPQSTAKYTRNKLDSYAAGALARFNNNYDQLHPEAKKVAEALGIAADLHQPVHEHGGAGRRDRAQRLRRPAPHRRALADGRRATSRWSSPTRYRQRRRRRRGAARHPVPRVRVRRGRHVPGRQLHHPDEPEPRQHPARLRRSWCRSCSPRTRARRRCELALEMLVRAYDPCISCSTHYLDVTFVR